MRRSYNDLLGLTGPASCEGFNFSRQMFRRVACWVLVGSFYVSQGGRQSTTCVPSIRICSVGSAREKSVAGWRIARGRSGGGLAVSSRW